LFSLVIVSIAVTITEPQFVIVAEETRVFDVVSLAVLVNIAEWLRAPSGCIIKRSAVIISTVRSKSFIPSNALCTILLWVRVLIAFSILIDDNFLSAFLDGIDAVVLFAITLLIVS